MKWGASRCHCFQSVDDVQRRDFATTILLSKRQPLTFIDLPLHHAYHCAIP